MSETGEHDTYRRATGWAGYAAAGWAALFAVASFYWAAGGRFGTGTLPAELTDRAGDFWFVLLGLWGAGVAKLGAAALALALTRPWDRWLPYRPIRLVGWLTGVALTLYGGLQLAVRALMAVGLPATPAGMHTAAARWHLVLWDPWWLAGGLLFLAATWSHDRRRGYVGTGSPPHNVDTGSAISRSPSGNARRPV